MSTWMPTMMTVMLKSKKLLLRVPMLLLASQLLLSLFCFYCPSTHTKTNRFHSMVG
jgi:hypothetical protein